MRFQPDAIYPDLFVEPYWLGDHVVRLRFAQGRQAPPYLDALLHGREADQVMPEAPNRAGIAEALADVRLRFDDALRQWRGERLAAPSSPSPSPTRGRWFIRSKRAAVDPHSTDDVAQVVHPARRLPDVAALIRRTIAHGVDPQAIYTNGVQALTQVELDEGRVELAFHSSLHEVQRFTSANSPCLPLRHEQCSWYSNADAAETAAYAQLRVIPWTELALADPHSGAPVEGSAWLQPIARDHRWCIRSAAGETLVHVGWHGEPREALRALDLGGAVVRCCASCSHFGFSGMGHQMSNGTAGHCGRRTRASDRAGEVSSPFTEPYGSGRIVSIFDLCSAWDLDDALRGSP